jgi:hypothetical protein
MIRAKFRCTQVTRNEYGEEVVDFQAAYGTGENAQWSKATPSGQVHMNISTDGAQGKFQPGKHYFLDFTPADEPAK